MFFKLAWRNLWRNKRRTLIALASVFFAVILAVFMRSMQLGSYEMMINASVGFYTGYIQIHGDGYWDSKSLEDTMNEDDEVVQNIQSIDGVTVVNPRLETAALVSSGEQTKISQVIGIDPEMENQHTRLPDRLISGRYLRPDEDAILLTSGLAKTLNVQPGDTLTLFGQGMYGVMAAGLYPVVGIIRFPSPEFNNAMLYMPLQSAQYLFSTGPRLTSYSIMLDDPHEMIAIQTLIRNQLEGGHEVMNWQEMLPELVQAIEVDNASGILMLLILYVIVGFGIFGTVMMMTQERIKEFGVVVAIGLKKGFLAWQTFLETVMISLVGVFAGFVVSIPMVVYFNLNPIPLTGELAEAVEMYGLEPLLPFSLDPSIFSGQVMVVLVMGLVSALYPALVIRKLNPIEAIRK